MAKVALHTLGCKLNFSETSTIGNSFLQKGFEIVDFKDKADIYLFNTCTVTENAEKDCRQFVRRALRQNPQAYVIVTGCYAQLRPEEIAAIEGVDAVLGSNEKYDLFRILKDFEKKDLACIFVSPTEELNDFGPAHSTDADSRTRAYFKIQDGCDYKCSFCTIPLARGLSRSMDPDAVMKDLKHLIDLGYREIILTGVNVGDYGKSYESNLFSLLKNMVSLPGNFRLRVSSIEPNLLTDNIISLTADSEKLCNHFHIPLQSGSNEILKLMRRRYKRELYSDRIEQVLKLIPDAGIGVDVIVGFPGETDSHFLDTYNFINQLPVSYLHVFTYSERPDTAAISFEGTVDTIERKKRNNMLRILSEKKKNEFYGRMVGSTLNVLFEDSHLNGSMKGFSSNYVRVEHPYNPSYVNCFSTVNIISVENSLCKGEIWENQKAIDLLVG